MGGQVTSTAFTWDELFGDYYLRAYVDSERQDDAERQALAALRLAGCPDGGAVLDAPCGFGRHAIPIARAGYRIVGVDRSETLLTEARRRVGDGPAPELIRTDYRKLPLEDGRFDAAVNLGTSLGYLGDEEDTAVLAEIARVLRPGGRLVIEIMHRDLLVRVFREQDWRLAGQGRLVLEQRTFEPATGVVQTTQTLIEADGRREARSFSLRVYSATELIAMLGRAGFAKTKAYGGLDGASLGLENRLVLVAQR